MKEKIADLLVDRMPGLAEAWAHQPSHRFLLLAASPAADAIITLLKRVGWTEPSNTDADISEERLEEDDLVEDGFGSAAAAVCPDCHTRSVYVCRPGDIRCAECENRSVKND